MLMLAHDDLTLYLVTSDEGADRVGSSVLTVGLEAAGRAVIAFATAPHPACSVIDGLAWGSLEERAIVGSAYFAPADLRTRLVELARLAGLDVDAASFDSLAVLSRLRATLRPVHRRTTPEGTP